MHPNVQSNAIYNSQDMEANWVSINKWMDKEYVEYNIILYIYNVCVCVCVYESYSTIKKNKIMPFAAIYISILSEMSEKANIIWYDLYVDSTSELIDKTETKIIGENFPSMEKEIVDQVQEAQGVPYRINPRRNTSRHVLIKLTKTKHKERILKAAREKQTSNIQGKPHVLHSWSFSRNSTDQKGMAGYI